MSVVLEAKRPPTDRAKVTLLCPRDLVDKAHKSKINMSYVLEQALSALTETEQPANESKQAHRNKESKHVKA